MASVSFLKLHTPQDVKRLCRHCDYEYRQHDGHSNQEINKALTKHNRQTDDYDTVCDRYDDRIDELDSQKGCNKRKDRVTAFSLEIPIPQDIKADRIMDYVNDINNLVRKRVGSENYIAGYLHRDEKHPYKDVKTKQTRVSLDHMHIIVVPEINGKLNGREFSSAQNMKNLNNTIDHLSREKYGVAFLTGNYDKSTSQKTVEQLKNDSRFLEIKQKLERDYSKKQAELNRKELDLNQRETIQAEQEESLNHRTALLNRKSDNLDKRENEINQREIEVRQKEINIEQEIRDRVAKRLALERQAEAIGDNIKSSDKSRELPFDLEGLHW